MGLRVYHWWLYSWLKVCGDVGDTSIFRVAYLWLYSLMEVYGERREYLYTEAGLFVGASNEQEEDQDLRLYLLQKSFANPVSNFYFRVNNWLKTVVLILVKPLAVLLAEDDAMKILLIIYY